MRYSFSIRFRQYLAERFPLKDFIPLAAVFAVTAGICVQVRIYHSTINMLAVFLGIIALFLFLLRLRLYDEFKDFQHDSEFYPSRPVPRGLITLKELKTAIAYIMCIEMLIAASGGEAAIAVFLLSLAYSMLMFKEFFMGRWLRKHFTVYIISHELLVFPLFIYVFTLNGMGTADIGQRYFWILALFFGCQIFMLEVARKIRPTELETPSRDTYTAQYGVAGASILILCLGVAVMFFAVNIGKNITGESSNLAYIPLLVLLTLGLKLYKFCRNPVILCAKLILAVSFLFIVTADAIVVLQLLL